MNEARPMVEAPTRVSAAGPTGPDVLSAAAVVVLDAVAVTALALSEGPASRVRIAVRTAARRRTSDRAGDPARRSRGAAIGVTTGSLAERGVFVT